MNPKLIAARKTAGFLALSTGVGAGTALLTDYIGIQNVILLISIAVLCFLTYMIYTMFLNQELRNKN